ncbi:hypothetical protein V5O48_004375 [Marasmius crinis-equi]|uniref:chitin deacetylase n=1 Tax=Marasmius crinis-equi TaxID=585013 RepID=A0ABR3FQC2_9AGAR
MFAASISLLLLSSPLGALGALSRTNAKDNSLVTDPQQECKYYYYDKATKALPSFPPIWKTATLLANDTAGQAKWNSIKASVPADVPVKTLVNGDFSPALRNYSTSDPDCWWTSRQCTTPKHTGIPADIASVPEPLTIGYGFDDGPNCSHNAFYDYLQKNNQKATMFFIGSNVMGWPLEAQRALYDGHEICVHTWSHQHMTALTSDQAFAELWYSKSTPLAFKNVVSYLFVLAMQAIKTIVGVTPKCWRPPFGDTDDRIRAIANGLGLTTIIWKYDTFDWEVGPASTITPDQIDANYQSFINLAKNGTFNTQGGIVLTHEITNFTMSEAIKFYPALKAAFKYIVPVGVALNWTRPYVEQDYQMPSFAEYISGNTTKPLPSAALQLLTGQSSGGQQGAQLTLPGILIAGLVLLSLV